MKVEGLTFKEYMEYNAAEKHNIIHTCSLLLSFSQCDLDFLASLSFLCLQGFFLVSIFPQSFVVFNQRCI